ncbi:glycoside hydrolase family 2 TIM barrel-domain containing protein [Zunongwangia endophytica]|uniref:beta-galactosidase n=1 Tax=Zunongwangia endophytica TaxID=1808945 RepID=A0ABV8H6T3_9FLAO|nr:glycoside hydrolase family 2 TIM barrel-domain containing protein [Zunongwangia endophytica]MDN3594863.1 glycoside hydrolase family 2 TIM barrel-domain containing protein [Zunongwangia endophytica]
MRSFFKLVIFFTYVFFLSEAFAQETEIQYLSGTGSDQTVDWKFMVDDGRKANEWTTIPVPSNWEQFGFGIYNYGHAEDEDRGKEIGHYKYEFNIPLEWKNKQIEIVFEGSMTDTEVKINGKLAGPVHQGAFYRFKYNISDLLNFGSEYNLLEVSVKKHSKNESVNQAERHADYWIFGGIFRPVYLQAKPFQNIERVAINAQADGQFEAEIFCNNIHRNGSLDAQIFSLNGDPVGETFTIDLNKGSNSVIIQSNFENIQTWNPEDPNLYKVEFRLKNNSKTIHELTQNFGFRTIQLRERDGIYVNGTKIKFKGVNRHTFWPITGRASSRTRSIADAELIKSMNMNAVRMSHYPPDQHFLEVADSLGLFVLDELAGWHASYDTEVGSKLVKEMVIRDINHPSIVFWDNGNEGGHNTDLDSLFQKYDIQNRRTIHPWQSFNGLSNEHYRPYNYGVGTYWNGQNVVFPTEFLHGMYDGGAGAGLNDFWNKMIWDNPLAAGGFIWVFADEGVKRTDTGEIDTYNGAAADGILGPFHEKEASYYAIKEIWSPVHFQDKSISKYFDGKLKIENRYFYTNLKDLNFNWELKKISLPGDNSSVEKTEGKANSPNIAPNRIGELELDLPENWFEFDVLHVSVTDKFGKEIYTRSWPIKMPRNLIKGLISQPVNKTSLSVTEEEDEYKIKAGNVEYLIDKNNGQLKHVANRKGEIPFNSGPHLSAGKVLFDSLNIQKSNDSITITSSFKPESRMKEFIWIFYPTGWVKLEIFYKPEEYDVDFDYMGVDFSYPENLVEGVTWLGDGPYRVWKNRMQGVEYGIHQKDYNNTITGVSPMVYPEFKGYHSNLYWAKIESKEQSFLVATATDDVFLRLYTPEYPQKEFEARTSPPFPEQDISFMQAIPAIGSKTNQPERLGPDGQKNIFFDYGTFDDWRIRSKKMILFFNFSIADDD